ncbi:MAG: hypothetical protein EPO35_05410 [Acidobacteria bacterium]|nr:MAG: hypothetical protein EPO35_05410 [Acidobacteriota bacterium]
MAGLGLAAAPAPAYAQGDEIQVYDGGLAPKGVFNLTWHNNFTPKGLKTPAFPGAVTADKSFNGVTEWAYGVNKWFEAGLYLPLYTIDKDLGFGIDGLKLRTLVATPNGADRRVAIGLGIELSYNATRWDDKRVTSEYRPIIAWHVNPKVDIIVNPILDTRYDGLKNMVFAPSSRIAYNASDAWAVALETYSEFGALKGFEAAGDQSHQVYGVLNHVARNGVEFELGAGVGLTDASDRFVLKLILAKDLNKPKVRK